MSATMPQGPDAAALSPETLLEYEPFVRSCVRGLLKGEQEIQDVVQDTWVKALGQRGQVSQPKSWLARVARNVALDRRRGEGRRKVREEAAARPEESVDTSRARLEAHGNVVKAVLELDEPYRTVVLLSYYQELSPNRIAERLERKPATVRSQLLRAHKLLREKLDQEYGGDRQAWAGLFLPLLGEAASTGAGAGASQSAPKLLGVGGVKIAAVVAAVSLGVVTGPRILAWLGVSGGESPQAQTFTISDASGGSSAPSVVSSSKGAGSAEPAAVEATTTRTQVAANAGSPVVSAAPSVEEPEASSGVRIQVVDEGGRPVAGVPVALHFRQKDAPRNQTPAYGDFAEDKTRGDEGSVRVDPMLVHWRGGYDVNDYWAKIDGPGIDVRVPVDIDDEDAEVKLELPQTGSVEVTLLDEQGELLPLDGMATLMVPGSSRSDSIHDELRDGSTRFGFVGLGQSLRVQVSSREAGIQWHTDIVGPKRAGELVQVALHSPGRPRVQGLVLDEAGEPLRRTPLLFSVFSDEPGSWYPELMAQTDGEGRFRAELSDKVELGTEVRLSLFRQVPQGRDGRADVEGWIVRGGSHELGELRMRTIRSWGMGRCLDTAGNPVPGVELRATVESGMGGTRARSDEDGFFRMIALHGPFSIGISRMDESGYVLAEPANYEMGSDDLVVRLCKGGEILGRFLHPPQEDRRPDVWFYRSEDMLLPKPEWKAYAKVEEDGSFRAQGLMAGRYGMRIYRQGALLFEAVDIVVTEGEATRDARLQGIDFQDHLRTVEFEVVPGDDPRFFNPAISARDAEGRIVGHSSRRSPGLLSLEIPIDQTAAIVVRAHEYRQVLLEPPFDVERVVMRRGIPVTLMTHDAPSFEQGGRTAMLSFERVEDDPRFGQARSASVPSSIGRDGQATVLFPAPGTYRLCVSRHSPAGQGGVVMATVAKPTRLEVTIEVREEGGRIEIALPENLFE